VKQRDFYIRFGRSNLWVGIWDVRNAAHPDFPYTREQVFRWSAHLDFGKNRTGLIRLGYIRVSTFRSYYEGRPFKLFGITLP